MEVRTSRENRRTLSSQVYLKDRAGSQPLEERNDVWTAEADRLKHGARKSGPTPSETPGIGPSEKKGLEDIPDDRRRLHHHGRRTGGRKP
jgi:hypothetical protein